MAEALLDQQKELGIYNVSSKKKRNCLDETWHDRFPDPSTVDDIDFTANFAVFVSFIEVNNTFFIDLLDESSNDKNGINSRNSKIMNKDFSLNDCIPVTKVEVRNSEEALEIFIQGQQRSQKYNSAESSHRIFSMHVLQAPVDPLSNEVFQDKNLMVDSQLAVVEIGKFGDPLTANFTNLKSSAENINSVMFLRKCFELLKQPLKKSNSEIMPYHQSKLTRCFKSVFKRKRKAHMIVCLSEKDDYDQTNCVMQFAEMATEILNSRSPSVSSMNSLNKKFENENDYQENVKLAKDQSAIMRKHKICTEKNLNYEISSLLINSHPNEMSYLKLISIISDRMAYRKVSLQHVEKQLNGLREKITVVLKENSKIKEKNVLQINLQSKSQDVLSLERKILSANQTAECLKKKYSALKMETKNIIHEIENKDKKILDQKKIETKIKEKFESDKRHLKKIMEKKFSKKQLELERKMLIAGEKLKQFNDILNMNIQEDAAVKKHYVESSVATINSFSSYYTAPSETKSKVTCIKRGLGSETDFCEMKSVEDILEKECGNLRSKTPSDVWLPSLKVNQMKTSSASQKSAAIANPRHQKSHTNTRGMWIVHKPMRNLNLNTVLKPNMKKIKYVTAVKFGHLTKFNSLKYALLHQEQNSFGEMETYIYKAKIIPSAGGGVQAVFNDVETLKQCCVE